MQPNFEAALTFAWRPENDGQALHSEAHDSGGWTAWGVTQATWNNAARQGYVYGSIGDANQDKCRVVLHSMFWNAIRGDALPAGPDILMFDMAMLGGPGRAARLLQRVVGSTPDGIIGPLTISHAFVFAPADLLTALAQTDDEFLRSLGSFRFFGNGWERRLHDCEQYARTFLPKE